ncbi:PDZ domain-containing protein [bacterium]|nr:PDZ domain-containing protein [bacterium]
MAEMPDNLTASRSEEAAPEEDSEAVTENQLGVQVQNLDEDLAEQLGYSKDVKGVVVTSVEAGSVGQANGLQEGEVIEKVGQTRVNNVEQFKQAMEDADLDKGVLMLVRRGTLTRFIVVKAD